MNIKIISGGQTGVDRAALDVALKLNIPHGGWCPLGRKAEDGTIPNCYQLIETDTDDYSQRTKLNIRDSDGTLILVPSLPVSVTDGTILTISVVQEMNKPYLIVDLSNIENTNKLITDWIKENNLHILNIAGPRESQHPGIYNLASQLMERVMRDTLAEDFLESMTSSRARSKR